MLMYFGDATFLTWDTLLSYLHVLTDTPSRSSTMPAPASSPLIPYCSHGNTPQMSTMTGMELTSRPWLHSEFHWCTCAETILPMGCSQATPKRDRNSKADLFLGESDICDVGIDWRTPKSWRKHPWAAHTCTQPSISLFCIQGWACMVTR